MFRLATYFLGVLCLSKLFALGQFMPETQNLESMAMGKITVGGEART